MNSKSLRQNRRRHIFQDVKKENDGTVSWQPQPGDHYVITGILRNGRRFRMVTPEWGHASGINLWQANIWLQRSAGHDFYRTLLRSTKN